MNSLNKDYITAWSKYLLNGNYNDIDSKLTQLAENGEVSAICKWYLFNNTNINENIDSLVLSYLTEDYKKQLAVSYFLYKKDESKILTLLQRYKFLMQESSKISTLGCLVKKDIMAKFECNLDEIEEIENALLNFQFANQNLHAIEKTLNIYKSTDNILALADYVEMLSEFTKKLPLNKYTYKCQKQIKKSNRIVIKFLTTNYNIADILKNDVYSFILAKALTQYSNTKKEQEMGKIILSSLANRPYIFQQKCNTK